MKGFGGHGNGSFPEILLLNEPSKEMIRWGFR